MEGVQLTLKPEDVYLILGVGMLRGKSKELPEGNDQSSNIHEQLYNLLKYASNKWDTKKNKKDQGDAQDVRSQDKDAGAVPGQNMDDGAVPGQPTKKRKKNKKKRLFHHMVYSNFAYASKRRKKSKKHLTMKWLSDYFALRFWISYWFH